MKGLTLLIASRTLDRPAPTYTPIGPRMKLVSGIMMSMAMKGTKMSWTSAGTNFFSHFVNGPSTAAMSRGGKTWEL